MKISKRFNSLVSEEARILRDIADLKHPDERLAEVKAAYEKDKQELADKIIELNAGIKEVQAALTKPWEQYKKKTRYRGGKYVTTGYANSKADACFRLSNELEWRFAALEETTQRHAEEVYRYENWTDFMDKAENELAAVRSELRFICEKAMQDEIKAEKAAERKAAMPVSEPIKHILTGQAIDGHIELNTGHLRAIAGNCVRGCLIQLQTADGIRTYPLHKSILKPILDNYQNVTTELSDTGLTFRWNNGRIRLNSRDLNIRDKHDMECKDLCFGFAL
jgi:hypothetical protein